MFESFSRSWELVKASWSVLKSDKELIVFPIVSGISSIIVSLLFALPFFAVGIVQSGRNGEDIGVSVVGYVLLFIFYVVLYTVIFFCNSALIGAALIRLNGGDPTVRDGFDIAFKKINNIIGYAVISATVGVVLNALRDRGVIGQIAASIFGMAWNIITFLVVPVLVTENINPIQAVQRSGSLLKSTWGEQIIGNSGIGAVFGLIMVGVIVAFVALFAVAAGTQSAVVLITIGVAMIATMIAIGLISSTLQGIYQAAVYRYATDGSVGSFFDEQLVSEAFKPKRG